MSYVTDVGNIVMDAEPLPIPLDRLEKDPKSQPRANLLELAQEINSYAGIEEFDERPKFKRTPYQTSGNRPIFARNPARQPNRNFRQFRPGKYLLT